MKAYTLNVTELEVWKARNGKTDEDLAKMLRVNPATISRWRHGKNGIPLAGALEMERVTGIPLRTLFIEGNAQAPKSKSDRCAATAEQVLLDANITSAPEREARPA